MIFKRVFFNSVMESVKNYQKRGKHLAEWTPLHVILYSNLMLSNSITEKLLTETLGPLYYLVRFYVQIHINTYCMSSFSDPILYPLVQAPCWRKAGNCIAISLTMKGPKSSSQTS